MALEDYWRIGTGQTQIVLDGHDGPESNHTRGEGYSLRAICTERSDPPAGEWPDAVARYQTLLNYRPHAGRFDTYESLTGTVHYREQHAESPSLLVDLRPPADSQTGLGGWFLVDSVEDATTLPERWCEVEFELTYLAGLDEYADRSAVETALHATGP